MIYWLLVVMVMYIAVLRKTIKQQIKYTFRKYLAENN